MYSYLLHHFCVMTQCSFLMALNIIPFSETSAWSYPELSLTTICVSYVLVKAIQWTYSAFTLPSTLGHLNQAFCLTFRFFVFMSQTSFHLQMSDAYNVQKEYQSLSWSYQSAWTAITLTPVHTASCLNEYNGLRCSCFCSCLSVIFFLHTALFSGQKDADKICWNEVSLL